MNSPPLNASVTPPYRPAPFLVSGPCAFLSSDELMLYFEDFYASLEFVNTAPQMVFERLICNLSIPVNAAIEKARRASASGDSGGGIRCLQMPVSAVPPPTALPPVIPAPVMVTSVTSTPEVLPPTSVQQAGAQTAQHLIRSFSVADCPEWDASSAFECTKAFPTAGAVDLSRFAIALTSFQVPGRGHIIASASGSSTHDTGFSITLKAGPPGFGSSLKSASCSWLQLGDYAPDMQCGAWSLPASHGSNMLQKTTTHGIIFPMRYNSSPQVLVWLRGLHMYDSHDRPLELGKPDISDCGFTLQATNLIFHGAEISWLACSIPRRGMTIGTFHAGRMSSWDCSIDKYNNSSWASYDGYVAFTSGWFKAAPRVAVGFTGFEMDERSPLCLSVQVLLVTREGMKWRINGGKDGLIKYASCSFIAIE